MAEAIVGSYHLAKHCGGRGCLLGGVPGVAPGRVVVIGGGTAGINAARVATGIGADVTILEVDFECMRFLDITMAGASTVYSNEAKKAWPEPARYARSCSAASTRSPEKSPAALGGSARKLAEDVLMYDCIGVCSLVG